MSFEPSFSVLILGSNSALPAYDRHPTSQLLDVNNQYYLLDCGEGTQIQMRRYGVKMQRIKVVFISHLHGDHYFGLIGYLNSLHLLGRTSELTIVCPSGLKQILELQMDAANGRLQFPINYIFTDDVAQAETPVRIYADKLIKVDAFPLKHRVECCAFLIREKPRPKTFLAENIEKYDIPVAAIPNIKKGEDFVTQDGMVIPNAQLTEESGAPRTYAYCTDTSPLDSTISHVKGVDMLYHEATFTELHSERAKKTFHSTASQAATIAKEAQVKKLLIGHFSARYKELDELESEAQAVFQHTELAIEGKRIEIPST